MAVQERRRGKQRKYQDGEEEKPTKEEYAIAKHLRFNVPVREGRLVGMTVQCFIASKAVDCLLDSPWSAGRSKSDIMFTNRGSCVSFCDRLLQKGLFHRAARVERRKDRDVKKRKVKEDGEEKSRDDTDRKGKKEKRGKKAKEVEKEEEEKKDESEEGDEKEKESEKIKEKEKDKEEKKEEKKDKDEKKDEEKKKRREKKLKLEMHASQTFKDGDEVFVWIYDPVPLKTFVIGLLLVLGAIGVCLFPLWPPEVRLGVYYLSLAAAGFVGVILSLCIVRLLLFCLVWGVTFGRHHFWFLPNLTEDVGFFESFVPLYKHDECDESSEKTTETTETTTDDKPTESTPPDSLETVKTPEISKDTTEKVEESEGSEDNDNGYEIVQHEDIDVEEENQPDEADNDEEDESLGDKKTN